MAQAQNSPKQPKRAPTAGSFKPGQSGNPGGRPKDGESFATVLRDLLSKDGPEIANLCKTYAKEFRQLPAGVNMRSMIALRWIVSLMAEPTTGLLQQMIDRTDGPVPSVLQGDKDKPLEVNVNDARERLAHLVNQFVARTTAKPNSSGTDTQ